MKYRVIYILALVMLLLSGAAENANAQTVTLKGNVYGGGENAQVKGNAMVTVKDVMIPEYKPDTLLSEPKYSVFGGGLGDNAIVNGSTNVDIVMTKAESGLFQVVGGGMNGKVVGTCNVHIGSNTGSSIYNVYGGGYYAPVDNTVLTITGGKITNDVYGGGVIGGVTTLATTNIGMKTGDAGLTINGNTYNWESHKNQIIIGGSVYGANDVAGTVASAKLSVNGGTVMGDVYGAGNGNHPGYSNPDNVQYADGSSLYYADSYATKNSSAKGNHKVYKSRPRTTDVVLNIAGNAGTDVNDAATVDKVRIMGRVFGGGNSCNVGLWNASGEYEGGGSLAVNIGSHVQIGTRSNSQEDPTGLYMGSNGQYLVTQPDPGSADYAEAQKYYHYYYDSKAKDYKPGFGNSSEFKALAKSILTWSNDVTLNVAEGAQDIWLSNFVGGGLRGSMMAKTAEGKFDYSLPEGVTIGETVIGGAYNAYIEYIKEGNTAPEKDYSYTGGMLAEDKGNRKHNVHADPKTAAEYATAYFEPLTEGDGVEDDATKAKLYTANKGKALVHLDLKCAMHPVSHPAEGDKDHSVHGGTVYGGCYMSGNIEGDSWVDYGCYLSPLCLKDPLASVYFNKESNLGIYGEVADLERNNAMNVFGAGYGELTSTKGDAYLYIKSIADKAEGDDDKIGKFPYIFNAFGGSNMGEVAGNTNVYYSAGQQGTLLGSLYGGSIKGNIGGNTFVELASGFLVNVYGGSRQANIGGASHVWAYDGKYRGRADAQHLIICNLFGGNDIAGTISGEMPAEFTGKKWSDVAGKKFNTYVEVSADDNSANRGFPLIGRVFAGGNGEARTSDDDGVQPDVKTALLEIAGGTSLQAFGGGNKATVTGANYIFSNALSTEYAKVNFTKYQKEIMQKVFFNDVLSGYKWEGTELTMEPYHVGRLFGGNNLATMDIQPTWMLREGRLQNVYSGGNMGDMTYYNPSGKPTTGVTNNTPRGLRIRIDQPNIYIGSLFGGCRISNVNPTPKAGQVAWPEGDAGEDYYGATVNVTNGYIENIYGGNDISGTVSHGANVNIYGGMVGNVYGSGNGFYLYKWDKDAKVMSENITEEGDDFYYTVPANDDFGGEDADATQKLLTINAVRPSVEKAFLNISGEDSNNMSYVKGNVYCGGNAATVSSDNSFTKFTVGSYVTLNGVFMGCDGEAFTTDKHIAAFERLNGFDMGDVPTSADDAIPTADQKYYPNLLSVYMKAVEMKALPKGFNTRRSNLINTHIGTFCVGGNRGSMLVDKTVSLDIHNNIKIFDKVVAGCLNSNVNYNKDGKTITAWGGFTRPIADPDNNEGGNTKVKLNVASVFIPVVMDVPEDKNSKNAHGEDYTTAAKHFFLYNNASDGKIYNYQEFNTINSTEYKDQEDFEANCDPDLIWKNRPGAYAASCNIYGGCFQSGEIEGDVELNVYSNMLRYVNKTKLDEANALNVPCFNVYGAGFGQNSHVWGNVKINMDRSLDKDVMGDPIAGSNLFSSVNKILRGTIGESTYFNMWDKKLYSKAYGANGNDVDRSYPSTNGIFGGGRNGQLIGNSQIEVRNGMVYADVAGGCYSSDMYGSTNIVIGYPKYYVCNESGNYALERGDKWNGNEGKKDIFGEDLIKHSVRYLKGDLVPENVYQQIVAKNFGNASKFTPKTDSPTCPWDNVHIKIGRSVYGGGYSRENSSSNTGKAGSFTTKKLLSDADATINEHALNFDGRYDDIASTVGYGGNSSIMVGDNLDGTSDHVEISSLKASWVRSPGNSVIGLFVKESDGRYTHQGEGKPVSGKTYYALSGDGGIYGDGHLTFCEGFRAADISGYGWAGSTPKYPKLMNTFQRLDLLSVNDCCLMLQGTQDFATDQVDATIYSIARVNELRMNSSIDPNSKLGEITSQTIVGGEGANFNDKQQRNYLAFFNNIRYLGSLVTNDDFKDGTFHAADGSAGSVSYRATKENYINDYENSQAVVEFKKRNLGTARNAVGINNGYCLRIQNQEYVDGEAKTYYGPIVGVCEAKLLTMVNGEGGGYIYADNIHADETNFLNTSGNFVYPGVMNYVEEGQEPSKQFIIDDCFYDRFGTKDHLTTRDGNLDEAHYWYVEGNKYFFNTTLTAYTFNESTTFDLIENDPNILLSGIENGSKLNVKKVEWVDHTYRHSTDYDCALVDANEDYKFDISVGGNSWTHDMPRATKSYYDNLTYETNKLPQFNVHLADNVDNSVKGYYENRLSEPDVVKIYLVGTTEEEGVEQTYEYTITLNVKYLKGPSIVGGVEIKNCALPGERIGFSSDKFVIETPEFMPITSNKWQILPLIVNGAGKEGWDKNNGVDIPETWYSENEDGGVTGSIPALYKQNEYNIAYMFTAGHRDFIVLPKQVDDEGNEIDKEKRMIVVHNYHRMKEVVAKNLQIETMPSFTYGTAKNTKTHKLPEAKIYIEDEADMKAFVEYLNMAKEGNDKNIPVGLTGLDIILQKDVKLTEALPDITQQFEGTFHGDGYNVTLANAVSLFGDKLTGKVYNLGLIGGTAIADNTANVINSYVYDENDADFKSGAKAYALSHIFTPAKDKNYGNYVANYYADGDYQFASVDRAWSLRTAAPNYDKTETHHDMRHFHDEARWDETKKVNAPLYDGTKTVEDRTESAGTDSKIYKGIPEGYANDYLFFGQHLDVDNADAYPVHINYVANGDKDDAKGGNRIYQTNAYYQSKAAQKFYYNKDAWAINPTLTAIDYTKMTAEADGAETLPTKFSVDSNRGESSYDNAATGKVTQNLLVYNAGEDVFTEKDEAGIAEKDVVYHNIVKGSDGKFKTDYFHLVDKQDFHAPIAFDVVERAWYERMPLYYAESNNDAWEGICLPFTVKKVVAATNGEITHFYGTAAANTDPKENYNTLHHEYWLRGLTAVTTADDKTTANFQRPGAETGLFKVTKDKFDYTYPINDYFTSLDGYNATDNPWYTTEHTYEGYMPLTANTPYIVSFPGDRYYEFDLTGQQIVFSNEGVTVPVTEAIATSVKGYTHNGTFLATNAAGYGINDEGTAFAGSVSNVLPFRTYMTSTSTAKTQSLIFIDNSLEDIDAKMVVDNAEDDYLNIYPLGRSIIVESSRACQLSCHGISGSLIGNWNIKRGTNVFSNLRSGIYVVGGKKMVVK